MTSLIASLTANGAGASLLPGTSSTSSLAAINGAASYSERSIIPAPALAQRLISMPRNSFNKDTVDDFIGTDVAKARCDAIDPAEFPEHEEALRTLHRYLERWLGLREGNPFDL